MKKIILVIIFTLSLATLVSAQTAKPNIVFIITDDQRADTLDYMPKTMQLLAAQGILFNNSFASFPLCCPSRASFLTGLHVHNHQIWTNVNGGPRFKNKSLDTSTIATWLQNDGYRTGLIGKYLNDYEKTIPWPYMPPGWSEWDANGWPGPHMPIVGPTIKGDTSSIPSAKAVGFIKSTPPGQPFFLYLGLTAPHAPASSPKSDFALFANISPWNPPSYNET
ncbi:sulfatase-like hydrolase/transferase, partial [Candidatus Pacearchaeota archaeon]|nr:sulfatase-like hydrolase/transferase [Candidatus Pacearchaeota archaeon]